MGGDDLPTDDFNYGDNDDKPFDNEPFDAGVEANEESDPKTYIQQLSGKLGQSLRKYNGQLGSPDYDLEKFAINSVISATHTSEMDEEDKKDIINKVETSGQGGEQDVNVDGGDNVDVATNDAEGGEAPTEEIPMDDELEEGQGAVREPEKETLPNLKVYMPNPHGEKYDTDESVNEDDEEWEDMEDYERASREVEYGMNESSNKGWGKLMSSVRKNSVSGPWSLIIIDSNLKKVVHQDVVQLRDLIPAYYEQYKQKFPGKMFAIEDKTGKRVFVDTLKLSEDLGIPNSSQDEKMNLINKYTPALTKIGKKVGQDSESYKRFSNAITNGDEDFAQKMLRDLGIVQENLEKNSGKHLVNPKKTVTFVNELRTKLKEHYDMTNTDLLNVEPSPVETPTITPTETPTRTPRRNKPFSVPVIKPGTEPKPKASK